MYIYISQVHVLIISLLRLFLLLILLFPLLRLIILLLLLLLPQTTSASCPARSSSAVPCGLIVPWWTVHERWHLEQTVDVLLCGVAWRLDVERLCTHPFDVLLCGVGWRLDVERLCTHPSLPSSPTTAHSNHKQHRPPKSQATTDPQGIPLLEGSLGASLGGIPGGIHDGGPWGRYPRRVPMNNE